MLLLLFIGAPVKVPLHYSNLIITKLKLDGYRKALIKRKVSQKLAARKKLGLEPSGATKKKKGPKKEAKEQDLD